MLRNSDGMILLYDEETEGSPKYMREQALNQAAKTNAYTLYTITAFDLQSIAEDEQNRYD